MMITLCNVELKLCRVNNFFAKYLECWLVIVTAETPPGHTTVVGHLALNLYSRVDRVQSLLEICTVLLYCLRGPSTSWYILYKSKL